MELESKTVNGGAIGFDQNIQFRNNYVGDRRTPRLVWLLSLEVTDQKWRQRAYFLKIV